MYRTADGEVAAAKKLDKERVKHENPGLYYFSGRGASEMMVEAINNTEKQLQKYRNALLQANIDPDSLV